MANRYITSPPSDYTNARIPLFKSATPDSDATLESANSDKANMLAKTFFPPPPIVPIVPTSVYPKPLEAHGTFTHNEIQTVIQKLKPYKAPGVNEIQNIVLQKCVNSLIDHLFYLFKAILEFNTYPMHWLMILTIVLHKPGKAEYNVAKAYRPISLLETIGKLFSTLVAADLSFLAEQHSLLSTQLGGRCGKCTTDTIHLVVSRVKDAWRAGKVTSALFLNIQASFPNTVKDHLLHNMRSCCVPDKYICYDSHGLVSFLPTPTPL